MSAQALCSSLAPFWMSQFYNMQRLFLQCKTSRDVPPKGLHMFLYVDIIKFILNFRGGEDHCCYFKVQVFSADDAHINC